MLWSLTFFRENTLASDDENKKKLTWRKTQREMLDFCFAFLEYISFLWCRVLSWFDENSIVVEKSLRLIQTLIVEKKKNKKFSLDEKLNARCSTSVVY
jgi:hypothetical protein